MRIAHLADVHLDRPFAGLDTPAGNRSRQRLRAGFERCLAIAQQRGVDLITIGGDLWEEENVGLDTRRFVARALGQLEVPVLLICGNHDPYLANGNYARTDWPDNVHLFTSSELEEFRLDEVSVWGFSWTGGGLSADFLTGFAVPDDGRHHILLIHGTSQSIQHFADGSNHCPFDPAAVTAAGFERCLAGHIHSARNRDGVVYPGTPEPLGWSETGRHTVAIIEVGDSAGVELVDTNEHRYERVEISCEGCDVSSEVEERVEQLVTGSASDSLHLTIELTGEIDPGCEIDTAALTDPFLESFAELRVLDRTSAGYDLEHLGGQQTVTGIFVRKLQERISGCGDAEEQGKLETALLAGLRALDGRGDVVRVD